MRGFKDGSLFSKSHVLLFLSQCCPGCRCCFEYSCCFIIIQVIRFQRQRRLSETSLTLDLHSSTGFPFSRLLRHAGITLSLFFSRTRRESINLAKIILVLWLLIKFRRLVISKLLEIKELTKINSSRSNTPKCDDWFEFCQGNDQSTMTLHSRKITIQEFSRTIFMS